MQPVRILFITPGGLRERADGTGTIPAIISLLKHLSAEDQIFGITIKQGGPLDQWTIAGSTKALNLGGAGTLEPATRLALRYRRLTSTLNIHGYAPDVVHSMSLGTASVLGRLLSRANGIPHVASLLGKEFKCTRGRRLPQRIEHWVAAKAARGASVVTAGSEFALRDLRTVRPDALWLPLFPGTMDGPLSCSSRQNHAPLRLLTVASINSTKDPATMLGALAAVRRMGIDATLTWVGQDTLHGEIELLRRDLNIADAVDFVGFVPWPELGGFYASHDIYVQASVFESQGVAVCEAARAGMAIVGTAVGILPEIGPDATVAVPIADTTALANAIVEVATNSGQAARMGDKALRWSELYPEEWTARRFSEIYRSLVP